MIVDRDHVKKNQIKILWGKFLHAKRRTHIITACAAAAVILLIILAVTAGNSEETVAYRETTVQYGNLVVGITESGTVDIGTIEQVFELDMSTLVRATTASSSSSSSSSTSNSSGQMPGGMGGQNASSGGGDMFEQIFAMASASSSSSSSDQTSDIVVSEVCVTVGQQVEEGDVLYRLEEGSVDDLEEELQSNVSKAKADLDAVYADQIISGQTASYTFSRSKAYGSYAKTEYDATMAELKQKVTAAEESLTAAQQSMTEYQTQLDETLADYEEALYVLENWEWSRDHQDKWQNTYQYVSDFQMTQTAQNTADTLERKKEQLEQKVEQAEANLEMCEKELSSAKRNYQKGALSASQTYSLNLLAYDTAQETYDIALSYLASDVEEQEETYESAKEKWEEYASHITDGAVCAKYSGVVTNVNLSAGDSINTNDTIITLYDMEEITMTLTVDEADMTDITTDTLANISLTAYPDKVFQAQVTGISDAATDTSGNTTYDVTVTFSGSESELFQGMTGEVTFITKEMQEVCFVSNRAIIRKNNKSYVKLKTEDGKTHEVEVITGFSDGVNVEIIEGLVEGDVVLIESKVSES